MTVEPASVALNNISFLAIDGKMADFIAFEANLLRAGERIVSVFATENACGALCLIRALSCPVAAFIAVFAANQRVFAEEIA